MAAGESDEVSLAVTDEGHPLLKASFAEDAVRVGVDHVRLTLDWHASCAGFSAVLRTSSTRIHLLRSLAAVDRQAGLTPARLSALSVIVFAGPRQVGELASAEGVAGPTMTRIVDGLAAVGLAERRPDPRDGRASEIAATPAGEVLMRAAAGRADIGDRQRDRGAACGGPSAADSFRGFAGPFGEICP